MVRLVPADTDPGGGRPVRVRHAARHARTSEPRTRPRTPTASLSIRSAERRRWAADLSGPGSGGLVVCGMSGIGKSTLAAQIAARVGRLQSGRVMNVISGEVSPAAFAAGPAGPGGPAGPAGAGFVVLENFDDNLSHASGRWTVRDPDLAGVYAPEVLASFGTGAARVDVRVVAPDGSARYRQALAADLRARRAAGQQLLRDPSLAAAPSARAALAAGQVDARLLITLAALAASDPAGQPLRVTGFGAADPGAGPGLPVRTARLAASGGTARRMLAFLRAQRSPYQPGYAGTAGSVVTVEFAAPAPLGLLGNQ